MIWVCIALGGALGSISRYAIGLALARLETFPFGTLTDNALGSLIIGVTVGFWAMDQRKTPASLFIITGFFGGFNTFSASRLPPQDDWQRDAANITTSVAICLAFTWLGYLLAQSFKNTTA